MKDKKTAVLYLRVSTEMQVDGYSLEAQETELRERAEREGWKILEPPYIDAGKSGKSIAGRPAFQQMLSDLPEKRPDYVMVFKLSRLGRSTKDILNSLSELKKYGVNLYCMKENINTAEVSGKLMVPILGAVAEIERENISTQTMAGRVQKARDGRWNGGPAPYGYRLDRSAGVGNAKLVVEPNEAEVVKKIYQMYLTEHGVNAIAKILNDEGYRKETGGKDNRRYVLFSGTNIRSILDNEAYMGYIRYGRTKTVMKEGTDDEWHRIPQKEYLLVKGSHEALVDEETWYKCHAKRALNAFKREKVYSKDHAHVLSGILRCPVCGSPMVGKVCRKKKPDGSFYKGEWYYVCKHRRLVDGQVCSFGTYVRQDVVNAEAEAVMKEAFKDKSFIERVLKSLGADGDVSEQEEKVNRLQKELDKAEGARKRIVAKMDSLPDDDSFDALWQSIQDGLSANAEKTQKLKEQLAGEEEILAQMRGSMVTKETYRKVLEQVVARFGVMSMEDERRMMRLLFEKAEIYPEPVNGHWLKTVYFRIPLMIDGEELSGVNMEYGNVDNSRSEENTDETVVLLTRQ